VEKKGETGMETGIMGIVQKRGRRNPKKKHIPTYKKKNFGEETFTPTTNTTQLPNKHINYNI